MTQIRSSAGVIGQDNPLSVAVKISQCFLGYIDGFHEVSEVDYSNRHFI